MIDLHIITFPKFSTFFSSLFFYDKYIMCVLCFQEIKYIRFSFFFITLLIYNRVEEIDKCYRFGL